MRIKPHIQYAKYIFNHKKYVFQAGLKTGAPLWKLIIHDWSKLSAAEWGPYVRNFYDEDNARHGEFDKAWLHHQHRNPHHWQHWVLKPDRGPQEALEMPESLVREMVADWAGAGRAITGKWEVAEWWRNNWHQIHIHDRTFARVEQLVKINFG